MALLFCLSAFLPLTAASVLPRQQAAHLGRLLVCDGDNHVSPLSSYIRSHQTEPSDSLTPEQLFAVYLFQYGGWKTLRLFPHQGPDGMRWYAAADQLPTTMDAEHRKYIQQVFQHLSDEVRQEHWQQVDAYLDRMEQYQCTFGKSTSASDAARPSPASTWLIALLLLLFVATAFTRLSRGKTP